VVRTRVGYAGGTTKHPTYHALGDHTETIEVDYDPDVISYEQLLRVFWDSHRPTTPAGSRQYMSIIFYHDKEQRRLATASKEFQTAKVKSPIFTEIRPFTRFYRAEDYHQKYRLRSEQGLMREFRSMYPGPQDFVDSLAAARVNGYLDGYGTLEDLLEELPGLGLSPQARERLIAIVKGRKGLIACGS